MIADREAFARAAEALAGTRFRLGGRAPAHGLDCVGLVLAALAKTGRSIPAVRGYALRNAAIARWSDAFDAAGLAAAAAPVRRGDVLLLRPGPAQWHLAIAVDGARIAHAHAGLRRVVIGPVDPRQINRIYRLSGRQE